MPDAHDTKPPFRARGRDILALYAYVGFLAALIIETPNNIWTGRLGQVTVTLGILGLWRYAWWFTHFVRAQVYERVTFRHLRERCSKRWDSGWRPDRVYFMMTTYLENERTSRLVLESILRELEANDLKGTLVIGTASREDDEALTFALRNQRHSSVELDVVFVRQNAPGKRIAMGLALRALSRRGAYGDAPVVFIDGDTVLLPGCLRACLPVFAERLDVHALTTYERVIVVGNALFQKWMDLRFAQRHMVMQSHALSKKVLTLTGRMSVFRASSVVEEDFIRTVESDGLSHWLWGDFRFFSGDDKSTWYRLLQTGANMLYVPDARVCTLEHVEREGSFIRAVHNIFRWSGNMLRNGGRVIALGPRKVGLFIWWCMVDQRIAIWTALAGLVAMGTAGIAISPLAFYAFLVWVLVSRLCFSLVMFYYARRIDMTFPFLLYINQVGGALIKVYLLFHLPYQRWANRGDQRLSLDTNLGWYTKVAASAYVTIAWISVYLLMLYIYTGILPPPNWDSVRILLHTGF